MDSKCGPDSKYVYQIFNNDSSKYFSFKGYPLDQYDIANPCGLVAKSYFNDEFKLFDSNNKIFFINETGIANSFDKDYMYRRASDYIESQWIDVENEHFMVWMRMETFPEFKKIWGRIDVDLIAGVYKFNITNSKDFKLFQIMILGVKMLKGQ